MGSPWGSQQRVVPVKNTQALTPMYYKAGKYVVRYDYAGDGSSGITYAFDGVKNVGESAAGRHILDVTPSGAGISITITNPDPDATGTDYIKNIRVCHLDDESAMLAGNTYSPLFLERIKPFTRIRFINWQGLNPHSAATLTGASWAGGTATYNTTETYNFRPGEPIIVTSVTPTGYNASGTITAIGVNSISMAMVSDPGAYVSGGKLFGDYSSARGSWNARSTLTTAFWSGDGSRPKLAGPPLEAMLELLNITGQDGWFHIHHQADDDYITQFATMVRDGLTGGQTAYFELSNEVWNGIYSQYHYAVAQGKATWPGLGSSDIDYNRNWYGMRAAQMSDIIKGVFASAPNRVKCVFGIQSGYAPFGEIALNCALWNQGPCYTHGFDVLAGAPYVGATSVPAAWLTDPDGGLEKLFTEIMQGGIDPGGQAGGYLNYTFTNAMANIKNLADQYGLTPGTYEAGQHLDSGDAGTDTLFNNANRDARMGAVMAVYFKKLTEAGINLVTFLGHIGQYGNSGSWGASESILQVTTPKRDACLNWAGLGKDLGMNLMNINYYCQEQPVIDIMKTADAFRPQTAGGTYVDSEDHLIDKDSNGWVQSLTPTGPGSTFTKVNVLLLRSQPQVSVLASVIAVVVNVALVAMSLLTYPASVVAATEISALSQAMVLTTHAASVEAAIEVNATAVEMSLTPYPASVDAATEVNAALVAMSLTPYPATVDVASEGEGIFLGFNEPGAGGQTWPGWTWFADADGYGLPGWRRDDWDATWLMPRNHPTDGYGSNVTATLDTTDRAPTKSSGACLFAQNLGTQTAKTASWWFFWRTNFLGEGIADASTNRLGFYLKSGGHAAQTWDGVFEDAYYEIGTYLCWPGGGLSGQDCPVEANGQHYYHFLTPNPDAWIHVELDRHPQHQRGVAPIPVDDPASGSGHSYYEYMNSFYVEAFVYATDVARTFKIDELRLWTTSESENDISITSVWVGYWSGTGKWEIQFSDSSFSTLGETTVSTFEIRWSLSPITNANFGSATIIEPEYNEYGTTNHVRRPDSWLLGCWTRFALPAGTEIDNDIVYFAIKDVSSVANGDGHEAPSSLIHTIDYQIRP